MISAVASECRHGFLVIDAANTAAKKVYKNKGKSLARITTAPQMDQLSYTCGTIVNFGGLIQPNIQLARELGALLAFMSGYSVAFGHKDATPLERVTKFACLQMQPLRFADVWVAVLNQNQD
jgi:hypothetical protein